jgi:GntR family transcriptional regulator, vanillate catabolism transcriptional regulator
MSSPAARPRSNRTLDDDSQTGRTLLNLREMLLRGEFRPGERLSELPLVAKLGVSRTPLRLALDRLANEGLLDTVPTGGFVVREFTIADIWDAIETRGVLEGAAARLAAERLGHASELASLKRQCQEMDAMAGVTFDSFGHYLHLNEVFHASIVELAKSPLLRRTLEQAMKLPFASPSALVFARTKLPDAAEMFIVGRAQHKALVEAIEHREGTRAESIAREHARLSRRNLEAVVHNREIFDCVPGASLIRHMA